MLHLRLLKKIVCARLTCSRSVHGWLVTLAHTTGSVYKPNRF